MSIEWLLSSSVLVMLVMLIRILFRKKIPPGLRYALWLVVLLRLLIPVSFLRNPVSVWKFLPGQETEVTEEGQGNEVGQSISTGLSIDEEKDEAFILPENVAAEKAGERGSTAKTEEGKTLRAFSKLWNLIWSKGKEIGKSMTLWRCWLAGTYVCGGIVLAVNLDYAGRLRRSRKRIVPEELPVVSDIPVYETQMVKTPCLSGLFFPAVYVTEEAVRDAKTFRFVLCHENAHYKQLDHWWALMRIVCLCIHWFNPLVWLAACASRQDGEMACDEKTLKILGGGQRIDYGKTLLELSAEKASGMSGWWISTSLSGSARQMKERIQMLLNTPGRTVGRQLFVMLLAVSLFMITFTGESRAQEREAPKSAKAEKEAEAIQADGTAEVSGMDNEPAAEQQREVVGETEKLPQRKGESEPEEGDEFWSAARTSGEWEAYMARHGGRGSLSVDLNFDGYNDLCVRGGSVNDVNVPYYCMLWNPKSNQYEYSATLANVEIDREQWLISERIRQGNGWYSTYFYRYGADNRLHMVRYTEENASADAVFAQLDLTYAEDDGLYTLSAVADGTNLQRTLVSMARQSLTELYLWTGEKVDTACFQVTDMGSVYFSVTPEDMEHSRTFFSRDFGADTEYNLSNYDKSISSMYVISSRSVWYSPVLWRIFPEQADEMTDEEIIVWYLEQVPLVKECRVKSIEKRYEDMWTVQTQDGVWFEVVYDAALKEIGMVSGPYPDYPVH